MKQNHSSAVYLKLRLQGVVSHSCHTKHHDMTKNCDGKGPYTTHTAMWSLEHEDKRPFKAINNKATAEKYCVGNYNKHDKVSKAPNAIHTR